MAEYWSNNDRGYRIKLTIDQVSQNAEANTSTVRIRLTLFNTDRTFSRRQCKWYVDGFSQYIGDVSFFEVSNQNSELQIVDKTITVDYKNGNSYSVKAFFYGYGNADSPYDLTINSNVTLDLLDNVSTFEFPSNVTFGDRFKISISKKVASARHTIRYSWGTLAEVIAENVDTYYDWTIPEKLANQIPNDTSGWGEIHVDTYINGKLIKTKSKVFTASFSLIRAKPTFSRIALADANEKTRNIIQFDRHFVSVLSKIYARFDNVESKYGATITKYFMEIVGNNNTISAPSGTFREISVNKDTQFTLRGYVEDSRGIRSDSYETTITVLNYFSPTLRFEVVRSGATNSTLTIKRFAKVAPLMVDGAQKNPMKLTFTTRKVDSNNEISDNGGAGGTWSQISEFNASNANLGNSYPADTSYIVVGKLEDKFTSVSFQAAVPSDRIVMSYDKEGVGVNKYRERGALDVAGDIYANNSQIQQYQLTGNNGAPKWIDGKPNVTNANYLDQPGQYYIDKAALGNPNGQWGYLFHYSNYGKNTDDFKEAIQIFWGNNGQLFFRHHQWSKKTDDWEPWKEFVQNEHANLINTGWKPAGVEGSFYKRVGDVLTVKYNFTGTGSDVTIAKLPPEVLTAPQNYMFTVSSWSLGTNSDVHAQISKGTSDINVLSATKDTNYQGQLTIML